MALARYKKLCIDANDPERLGRFWAEVLGRTWEASANGEGGIPGPTPQHMVWINRVPEPKTVKHRVHLDIYTRRLADLEGLGATVLRPEGDDRRWTVMADPEGGEFCAFLRDQLPADRLHGVVLDSADPAGQANWWNGVLGGSVVHDDERGFSTVEQVPGFPVDTLDFVPVPEPKAAQNRIHVDLEVADLQALVDAGATVLRERGGDIDWTVMADPEGNEFCAFDPR